MYTRSLKRSLDLPYQTPNILLLKALGLPSLVQIAAHHIVRISDAIEKRFSECPESLRSLTRELKPLVLEYSALREPCEAYLGSDGILVVDLLANKEYLSKSLLGLVTGSFLTIRFGVGHVGLVGDIRLCPKCRVPADQRHFLNSFTVNVAPREVLLHSLPSRYSIGHLLSRDFYSFYKHIRELQVTIAGYLGEDNLFPEPILNNISRAAL